MNTSMAYVHNENQARKKWVYFRRIWVKESPVVQKPFQTKSDTLCRSMHYPSPSRTTGVRADAS